MLLYEWAQAWGIPFAAVADLEVRMGTRWGPVVTPPPVGSPMSEGGVSNLVRLEASRKGARLFRNNVGVLRDEGGRPVRYGLANDSPALNKVVKSADLIGWQSHRIEPADVGRLVAVFLSVETKAPGWSYSATPREVAQRAWADMVVAAGGRALFVNREGLI